MANYSNYDVLVFDMEDALVDQGASLATAVSRAVDAYLTVLLGVRAEGGPVFSAEEVRHFMDANDFDTDTDVLHALLTAALHALSVELDEDDFLGHDGRDLLDAVRATGKITDALGEIARRKNMAEFSKWLRQRGGGKRGFSRLRNVRNQWMVLAEGHIMMDNVVKRILAEVYLGAELFLKEYHRERQFYHEHGVIGLEQCWLDPAALASLRKRCPFAAVSSRSQAEAQFVLANIGVDRLFDVIVSQDAMGMGMADLEEVSWIRDLGVGGAAAADYSTRVADAIERVRAQEGLEQVVRVGFVGNCAREGRAIPALKERYRLTAIGAAFGADKKVIAAQREKGADIVAHDPGQLVRILSERPRMRSTDYS
ncbi:MAG TPA: hypothetical protein PK313_02080 [Myxococcota bacterium]|jgi:phosphoglycolate phosphatase-like HAD superfamily hydrolase|nr:hypothetical protein [Myxococcota bacterium]